MKKCAVIIGVNKTGGLPQLSAAAKGAIDFKDWADNQDFDTVLLTDEDGKKVKVNDIFEAVKGFVDKNTYSQMIIFFSGHGILKGAGDEQWLLSDSPTYPNETVSVLSSRYLARRTGIPHIVFISDACRSIPNNEMVTQVLGSAIFPNVPISGSTELDIFYATMPGSASYEAKEDDAISNFKGIYTHCLLRALKGEIKEIVQNIEENHETVSVVPAYELKQYLQVAVQAEASRISIMLSQQPDGEITSRIPKYISKISLKEEPTDPLPEGNTSKPKEGVVKYFNENKGFGFIIPDDGANEVFVHASGLLHEIHENDKVVFNIEQGKEGLNAINVSVFDEKTDLNTRSKDIDDNAILPDINIKNIPKTDILVNPIDDFSILSEVMGVAFKADKAIERNVSMLKDAGGRQSFQTNTGFSILGAVNVDYLLSTGTADQFLENGKVNIRIHENQAGNTIFLILENRNAVPLAILPGFIATVVIVDNKVINVNYVPSRSAPKYEMLNDNVINELEPRRALIAASAQFGLFKLEGSVNDVVRGASYLRNIKAFDPTLGLYSSYAYAQAGRNEDVLSVYNYMLNEPEPILYDVYMLGRISRSALADPKQGFAPFCPMLTQGWSYMSVDRSLFLKEFEELGKYLIPGLWTTFNHKGVEIIKNLLKLKIIV